MAGGLLLKCVHVCVREGERSRGNRQETQAEADEHSMTLEKASEGGFGSVG